MKTFKLNKQQKIFIVWALALVLYVVYTLYQNYQICNNLSSYYPTGSTPMFISSACRPYMNH